MKSVKDESRSLRGVLATFGEQVERRAHATAVVDDSNVWTYAELDLKSDAVGQSLIARGGGPGALVAVVMKNSANLIVVLLGILKSGAGYVPVSRDDPDERIARVIANSRASLIVVDDDNQLANRAGSTAVVRASELMHVEANDPPGQATSLDRAVASSLGDIAYVIYTSGSTGVPKGVVINHAALATYLRFAKSEYPALAGRTMLHSSISFDMSVTSLFGPLVSGGTIEVGNLLDIAEGGVPSHMRKPTFLKVTPSHLPILEALPPKVSPSELLVVGGEALYWEALRTWWDRNSDVAVINEYGPTEATVGCCIYRVEQRGPRSGAVPIGEPTDGTRLHVLDSQNRETKAGEPGELYIAGAQLARGYLHNPEMSSKRFLPNPFGARDSKMYKTGDLVRRQPSGALEFIGRQDSQVKIDGHRVELGEIESAILQSAAIAQAAVLTTDTKAGSKQLSAFVRPAAGTIFDAVAFRKELETTLPSYMIPSRITALSDFKLTPNGKLDRAQLAAERVSIENGVPPETDEELLCRLISEVTGTSPVGVDDDFMDLGGTSVGAARLVGMAREAGVNIALMEVLRHRTVRGILRQTRTRSHDMEKGIQ